MNHEQGEPRGETTDLKTAAQDPTPALPQLSCVTLEKLTFFSCKATVNFNKALRHRQKTAFVTGGDRILVNADKAVNVLAQRPAANKKSFAQCRS